VIEGLKGQQGQEGALPGVAASLLWVPLGELGDAEQVRQKGSYARIVERGNWPERAMP